MYFYMQFPSVLISHKWDMGPKCVKVSFGNCGNSKGSVAESVSETLT
jgi:hypothetical protein